MGEKIKVLLVDDHEMVRMGLAAFLSTVEEIDVVGEASNGEEGVQLAQDLKPDVILMDLVMEKLDGIEATKQIKKVYAKAKVIVLTSFIDDEKVYPVMEAGAFSYILKTSRSDEILQAIKQAYRGQAVFEAEVTQKMMNKITGNHGLPHGECTNREMEILKLIGEGKTNQDIADELYIGIKTVKTHVSNILSKLGVDDRTQVAIYAHKNGICK